MFASWCNSNQHLIKTTLHPSAAYIPPEDYAGDPTLPKPPNFVKQFECMRLFFWLIPYRLTPERLQQGSGPTTPFYTLVYFSCGRIPVRTDVTFCVHSSWLL